MLTESGDRLNIYRNIKNDLNAESYVTNIRSVGMRRVLAGLQAGCLLLALQTSRYTGVPFCQRTCRLCDCGELEDQTHFLIICPTFMDLRLQLFIHCNSLSGTFFQQSLVCKLQFILSYYDDFIAVTLSKMYAQRQTLLFNH